MTSGAFSKARAPTQLPPQVVEKIANVCAMTGKGAAKVRAKWNREPQAVLEALSTIPEKAPAKQVFAAICDDVQRQSRQASVLIVPRVDLERVIAEVTNRREAIPTTLLEFLGGLLGQRS